MSTRRIDARLRSALLVASLPALLRRRAESHPDRVAVVRGDTTLSFRQLAHAATSLANRLAEEGLGVDDCVGLYVEPSLDLMVGAWGVLFSGAAYLPLSPEYPDERLRFMLEDSGATTVVTQDHLVAALTEIAPAGIRVVTLGGPTGPSMSSPEPRPDSLAYVIYTSGSTGRPKGVMIEHHSVVSQIRWMHACGHLGEDVTVLQKTPMSFDAAQWEILAPAVGSRVVMGAPGIYRDTSALIDTITDHQVTTIQCVPTLLRALLDTDRLHTCTTLRRVFSGGEVLSRQLARDFADRLPWSSLVNLYGPTECTINATAYLVDPDTLSDGAGSVPIGVPVDNTQCFILDAELAPADIGEVGELYIGGAQLARGYLGRPDHTHERFVPSPFVPTEKLYRTGDLAHWNPDGSIQFAGRVDNQVKLRGHRVELEEIAVAIEEHTWVRRAAVFVTDDHRTNSQRLLACIELNPKEAALMDQGNHGSHHQSKSSRLQVRAQLSNPGVRHAHELGDRAPLVLPAARATARQRYEAFARKSYRFYDGGRVTRTDLLDLLRDSPRPAPYRTEAMTLSDLGEILRWFGQFRSEERLLPKYAYASPGALYATQLCVETGGLGGLEAGVHYFHPLDHCLHRTGSSALPAGAVRFHFIGRRSAIEPVYSNNILEVLEFETGHMVGLLTDVLDRHDFGLRPAPFDPPTALRCAAADTDHYLGSFDVTVDSASDHCDIGDDVDILVQAHPDRVDGMAACQYLYRDGALTIVSDKLVQAKNVIAINQQVYARASFGISLISRTPHQWMAYIELGAALHRLQRRGVDLRLGLMSSGYSSKSGHPLPAARRIDTLLTDAGIDTGPSYFAVGGKISDEQIRSEGMHEDIVHMRGPAEIVQDELAALLPAYMLPNRIVVVDALPLTANGKVDTRALASRADIVSIDATTPYVAPTTATQQWLARAWGAALHYDTVSIDDEFFAAGGNSLTAVALINTINRHHRIQLPIQVILERPRLKDLAERIDMDSTMTTSRMVLMHNVGTGNPVFCWPGLGGYPMNLRRLGGAVELGRPFYGVQALGVNAGEQPYSTVADMAAADIDELLSVQPAGPYMLWGYSFGARVAFEAAWQLEQSGRDVERVLLLCPGNPEVTTNTVTDPATITEQVRPRTANFSDPTFVTILLSVFTGRITGSDVDRCREVTRDEATFTAFVTAELPHFGAEMVRRIVRIVTETYQFEYTFDELAERRLRAPVTIFRAAGDNYSFLDRHSTHAATNVTLDTDHYNALREHGVDELASAIRAAIGTTHDLLPETYNPATRGL